MAYVIAGKHKHSEHQYLYSKGVLKVTNIGTLFLTKEKAEQVKDELTTKIDVSDGWELHVASLQKEKDAVPAL